MLLHDDVVYQVLQWLPVISLLRFKLVCKTWRALIESNDFIKQHLHHHHYDPNLKDKNHSLIRIVESTKTPFSFPLISIDCSEDPNTHVQLDLSYLCEYFPLRLVHTLSHNGIVCFSFHNLMRKYSICLWNPATRQSRVLPQSPAFTLETEHFRLENMGFGFDAKNNDYKVVNLCKNEKNNEGRVDVYSLDTDSWRSVTTDFLFIARLRNPRIPFNNGTCFLWSELYSKSGTVLCFDFSSEKFRSIPFPNGSNHRSIDRYAMVVSDKIACVSQTNKGQTKIWVLNGYGSANESWVELYTIDALWTAEGGTYGEVLFMNGDYLFFRTMECMYGVVTITARSLVTITACAYNVVTKERKNLSTTVKKCSRTRVKNWNLYSLSTGYYGADELVDFKESLLSVGKGSKEILCRVNKKSGAGFFCCFQWLLFLSKEV